MKKENIIVIVTIIVLIAIIGVVCYLISDKNTPENINSNTTIQNNVNNTQVNMNEIPDVPNISGETEVGA